MLRVFHPACCVAHGLEQRRERKWSVPASRVLREADGSVDGCEDVGDGESGHTPVTCLGRTVGRA